MDIQTSWLVGDVPGTVLYDNIAGDITEHVSYIEKSDECLHDKCQCFCLDQSNVIHYW